MRVQLTDPLKQKLFELGIETLSGKQANYPLNSSFEPPLSLKWMNIEGSFHMGSFSYAVSGYYGFCSIGRYTSIGEQVQVGRGDHPFSWLSSSPIFYLRDPLFKIGKNFGDSQKYYDYKPDHMSYLPTEEGKIFAPKVTLIGNDVWIGHGAILKSGVTIGDGAVIGAGAIVTKDIPPYAVAVGSPAVVKKYRFSEGVIDRLLELKWWQYAPWDLSGISPWNIEESIQVIEKKVKTGDLELWHPKIVFMQDIVDELKHNNS
jgi:acetyltransferase-like isoleucine patch superfamily enzyme